MDILMVASEAVPYLRTSDVANVVTGLSAELRRKHNVRVVLPHYRSLEIESTTPLRHITEFPVHLGAYTRQARVQCLNYETASIQLPVYLIDNEFYFGRDNPYGYLDDYERFIFFTRAIIEMLGDPGFCKEEGDWKPEVIHGHDWIAGLLPMCLRHACKEEPGLKSIAFVYTIHNASFPGQFGYRTIKVAELDELGIYRSIGETPNEINFMARGILAADAINTVSPHHAEEINNAGHSYELAQALRVSQKTITGILNGFDYASYKSAFDESIKRPFDQDSLESRQENKRALQEECELSVRSDIPLLGMISRLIPDKGIGLLEEIIPKLVQEEIQVVIAGIVGDDYRSREVLSRFQREYPRHVAPIFTSGDSLFSRKVVAGADIILVPSIREPCGSQQMTALRYGAIPVVRNTGGLADTVTSWNSNTGAHTGKGFLFNEPTSESLLQAIRDAVHLYRFDQGKWQDLQVHNMGVRFSWRDSAERYVEIYEKAKETRKLRLPIEKGEEPELDQSDLLLNAILEISELGVTIVDQEQYLVQVARKIRELMKSDAVLIWLPDETDPQQLSPIGHSFKRHGNSSQLEFDPHTYRVFSEQDSRSWQYIFHLKSEGEVLPPARLGFLSSELAQRRGWANQLSVPANAHGMFLGKIDVFSCETQHSFSEEIHILQAFANAVAVSLEKSRASRETQALLTADREMAKAQTVTEIVEVVLRHAKKLTHAEAGRLDLSVGRSYSLDSNDQFRVLPPRKPMELQPGSPALESRVTGNGDPFGGVAEAWEAPAPLHIGHGSQILTRITNEKGEAIGIMAVSKSQPVAFLKDEERVLRSLASQATHVLQAAYSREQDDQSRVGQLRKLAASLAGGVDFDTLLRKVVSTTADVLQAEGASLYLINEKNQLVIQAAHGYHELLLAAGSAKPYDIGEGITGWLAERGETFKADSLEELHAIPQWKGKHKGLQNEREPSVFLGIPLKVTERVNQQERVIGVLKLEDRIPQRPFTDQDMRLGEMMANVIATVIQNTRLSETSLRELNANLRKLSTVLMGGLEMRVLVQRIVDKIAEVVGADASSLYLIEPGTQMLSVQAATGYQSGLVAKGAEYDLHRDKGITAWIARTGRGFKANSVDELRSHSEWAGKHNPDQGNREPNAFLGIPLKVIAASGSEQIIGVLKVEDIRPGPRHPESYFTEQDDVLVEMMGNVITTVIQNTRLSNTNLEELLSDVFVNLVPFKEDPYKALHPFVSYRNEVVLNAISQKLLSLLPDGDRVSVGEQVSALNAQTTELLNLDANPELFRTLAKRSKNDTMSRWYDTLYYLYQNPRTDLKKVTKALSLGQIWQDATDITKRVTQEKLRHAAKILATTIAQSAGGEAMRVDDVGRWVAFEMPNVLSESSIRIPESLYMLFFMGSEWQSQEDMANFRLILPRLEKVSIISVVSSLQKEDQKKSTADLRRELEIHAIDFIPFTLTDVLAIVSAKQPQDLLLNRLLQEINLLTVSPYKTTGPTFDKMFFGREKEIREITDQVQSTSYAIIGGRRVGKSSFLIRLHMTSLPKRGFRSVYHDCNNTPTYEDFLAAHPRNWQPVPESQRSLPQTFGDLLRFPPMDMPLVLLLDEADKLIPADRTTHWPLFNALRASASLSQVHVILCGERSLRSALRDDSSPLFNFVNERPLGPLDYPAVEKLVTRPMQQMGITLVDEDAIVKHIWNFTSGHPNVVQRLCHKLIVRLNERRSRQIRLDDVEEVINDPEFQEVDFLETYLAQATSLERIIALLIVMNKEDKPYRLQSIIELLAAQGFHPDGDVAKNALDRLTDLRSILKRSQAGYEFAVKAFPKVLENRVTAEDMLIKLKSEYMRDPFDVMEAAGTITW